VIVKLLGGPMNGQLMQIPEPDGWPAVYPIRPAGGAGFVPSNRLESGRYRALLRGAGKGWHTNDAGAVVMRWEGWDPSPDGPRGLL